MVNYYLIFNVLPLENIFGHFGMTFAIFTYYQHFIDNKESKTISSNIYKAIIFGLTVDLLIFAVFVLDKNLLIFNHSYLYMGIIAIIPLIIASISNPKLLNKFLHLGLFFSILFFILEIIGVYNGYWSFNGSSYLGLVYIGNLRFAFDDFIFWVMLYPSTIVCYYEYFLDDMK